MAQEEEIVITLTVAALVGMLAAGTVQEPNFSVKKSGELTVLSLGPDLGFHTTRAKVENARAFRVGDTTVVALWKEVDRRGMAEKAAISLDGVSVSKVASSVERLYSHLGDFDPLKALPRFDERLKAGAGNEVYLVQFQTLPLAAYREALRNLGAQVYGFFPMNAFVVRGSDSVMGRVRSMPFVRAVVPYHPAFKVTTDLRGGLAKGTLRPATYNVAVHQSGPVMKESVASAIRLLGGTVVAQIPDGYLLEATLTSDQLLSVLKLNDVSFADPRGEPGEDMDILRSVAGAVLMDTTYGYRGQGVRAEVMDGNVLTTHEAFLPRGILIHRAGSGSTSHGTSTTGIVFGDGSGNVNGTGCLIEGQPIFAGYSGLPNRYTHTAEMLQSPYFCVFQSNSWGNPQTTQYTAISQQMDDILFQNNITIFQSQSNTGNQTSRPEAWAKNIISVGGITHQNTASRADDQWTGASIGPASDGRLKPDVSFWYDNILCPTNTNNTAYTAGFNGTSAATPMTAGLAGIFFQMWSDGYFYNPALAATVFENRPRSSFVKAMLANTAYRYAFAGSGANLSRYKQGWGTADLGYMNRDRNSQFLVNERDVLQNLQSKTYRLWVPAGTPEFRATMVYLDPPPVLGAALHRVNDLTLKVTSPGGTVYWGNNGLADGNLSTSGGVANVRDTTECVFLNSPQSGVWTVAVIGSDINTDARVETPGVIDADYSLVVTGVEHGKSFVPASGLGLTVAGSAADMATSNNVRWQLDGRDPVGPRTPMVAMDGEVAVPGGSSLSELRIRVESNSPTSPTDLSISLLKPGTNTWETVSSAAMQSSDFLHEVVVPGDLSRFIGPGGKIRAIFRWQRVTRGDLMYANVDQIRFEMQP